MKPVFEIHRIEESLFDLPLEHMLLTFDDGYIDHYVHFQRFCDIPTKKIYFVVPIWLNTSGHLSIDQLLEMSQHPDVEIGCHGYAHLDTRLDSVDVKKSRMLQDTDRMCEWFDREIGYIPHKFCFPYNYRAHGIFENILRARGFSEFYGDERIRPEQLRDAGWTSMYAV